MKKKMPTVHFMSQEHMNLERASWAKYEYEALNYTGHLFEGTILCKSKRGYGVSSSWQLVTCKKCLKKKSS